VGSNNSIKNNIDMEEFEIEDTSGFYKYDEVRGLQFGRKIHFPNGLILDWQLKDTYEYPVDGWTWYDEKPSDPS
jgi:hypothetical protein